MAAGAPWGSNYTPKPPNWDPIQQLLHIGYVATSADRDAIAREGARELGRTL